MNYTENELAYMWYSVMLLLEIFRNPECGLHASKLHEIVCLSNFDTGW